MENSFENVPTIDQTDSINKQEAGREVVIEIEGRLSKDSAMSRIKTRLIEELEPMLEIVMDTRSDLREQTSEFIGRAKSIEGLENEAGDFFKSLIPEGLEHDYYDKDKKVDTIDTHSHFSWEDRQDYENAETKALRSRKHYRRAHEQLPDLNVFVEGDTPLTGSFNEGLTEKGNIVRGGRRRLVQQEDNNLIYEKVGTITPSDKKEEWFYVESELFIKNISSGLGLDLGALLPHNYEFRPSMMKAGVHDIRSYFNGDETAEERFAAVSSQSKDKDEVGFGYVEYGNMRETGAMISLFHEIAHAWQRNYSKSYGRKGRQAFDKSYEKVQELLDELNQIKKSADRNTEEKMRQVEVVKSELNNLDIELTTGTDAETIGIDTPLHDEEAINIQGKIQISDAESAMRELDKAIALKKNGATEEALEVYRRAMNLVKPVYYPVKSKRLKGEIDSFISEERDAWAHSLRMLRFLRSRGLDVEPGLKTLEDIKKYIDPCLDSYQHSLEKMVSIGESEYRFSRVKPKG